MAALSLPVLAVSETEIVFHKSANQRHGGTNIDQSEEWRDGVLPSRRTRLQQTLIPKSASSSCHCGHKYLETDDKSLENYLTNIASSSREYLNADTNHSDVSMSPDLSEILILDEIQTNKKDCPEVLISQQKV